MGGGHHGHGPAHRTRQRRLKPRFVRLTGPGTHYPDGVAAPEFVPGQPNQKKYYASPPRREGSWQASRPGELGGPQPRGAGLGSQGPDQGYALKLAGSMEDQVHLTDGERWEDAQAGCVSVALKRASLFGRAPTTHDLTIAFTVWGFLDAGAADELVEARTDLFERVDNPHHYLELRRIGEAVPEATLRKTPAAVSMAYASDWSSLLDLSAHAASGH